MSLPATRVLLVLVMAAALFVISFQEPAIFFRQMETSMNGGLFPAGYVIKSAKQMFLASLFGPFFGNFAGLANPFLFIGGFMILRRHARKALICLAWALAFALQTFQLMLLPYHEDEGGVVVSYMIHPLAGWYCWFSAILLVFLLALEQYLSGRRSDACTAKTA